MKENDKEIKPDDSELEEKTVIKEEPIELDIVKKP